MTLEELKQEYRPYDQMPEFAECFADYEAGVFNRHKQYDGVAGQAYDRGLECASRAIRLGLLLHYVECW